MDEVNPCTPLSLQATPLQWEACSESGVALVYFAGQSEPLIGDAKVDIDDTGEVLISIDVRSIGSIPSGMSHEAFGQLVENLRINRIVVTVDGGTYVMRGHSDAVYWWDQVHTIARITSLPQRSRFHVNNAESAVYWTAPLVSFRYLFLDYPSELSTHPLCSPHIKEHLQRVLDGRDRSYWDDDAVGGVIAFLFADTIAFIQPVEDYAERRNRLQTSDSRKLITAWMVGCVDGPMNAGGNFHRHHARGFAVILSLATGVEVSLPWVQHHDAQGRLVQRDHRRWSVPPFRPSTVEAFDSDAMHHAAETGTGGVGHLLNAALTSEHFGSRSLYVATRRLLRTGRRSYSLDDWVDQACRSAETIYHLLFGVSPHHPLAALASDTRQELDNYLNEAARRIKSLANRTRSAGEATSADFLLELCRRVRSDVKNVESSSAIGTKLIRLIDHFDFHDLAALDHADWSSAIDPDASWTSVVSQYRNEVTHQGHLVSESIESREVYQVVCHLSDLLMRMILHLYNYDGLYSCQLRGGSMQPVNWATANTPSEAFGYRARKSRPRGINATLSTH